MSPILSVAFVGNVPACKRVVLLGHASKEMELEVKNSSNRSLDRLTSFEMAKVTITRDTDASPAAKPPSMLVRVLAAAFYGCASFLIVVVNKLVLTSYKYVYLANSWLKKKNKIAVAVLLVIFFPSSVFLLNRSGTGVVV